MLSGTDHVPRSRPRVLAGGAAAVLGGLAVLVLYLVAVVDPTGRSLDRAVGEWVVDAGSALRPEALGALGLVSTVGVLTAVAVLAGTAVVRDRAGRGSRAAVVVAVVLCAQTLTQTLKAVLPRVGAEENSLPSGHVTVVASLAVGALLVLPPVLRPLVVVVGSALVAGTGIATMIAGWHRPSDVAAALAVVVAVTGAALAAEAVLTRGRRRPPATAPGRSAPADARTRVFPVPPRALHDRTTVPVPIATAPR